MTNVQAPKTNDSLEIHCIGHWAFFSASTLLAEKFLLLQILVFTQIAESI